MATTDKQADDGGDRASPLVDLTAFERDILAAIHNSDDPEPHGLGISDRLENAGYGEVHHGRLYPALDNLVGKGLVEKGSLDRRTNYYAITTRGERELAADARWRA